MPRTYCTIPNFIKCYYENTYTRSTTFTSKQTYFKINGALVIMFWRYRYISYDVHHLHSSFIFHLPHRTISVVGEWSIYHTQLTIVSGELKHLAIAYIAYLVSDLAGERITTDWKVRPCNVHNLQNHPGIVCLFKWPFLGTPPQYYHHCLHFYTLQDCLDYRTLIHPQNCTFFALSDRLQ